MTSESESLARLQDEGGDTPFASTLAYGSGPDRVHELGGPAGAPTLVVVHGGYFRPAVDRTHARPLARALAVQGWQVALAEYRRTPGRPDDSTDDLAALDAHLRESGHDVTAWVGHSAGGALVLWRALTPDLPPVRAVALAPVADFDAAVEQRLGSDAVRDWIGAGPQDAPLVYSRLDPTRLASADPAAVDRIRVVHGDQDLAVPIAQSDGFAARRTVVEGAHHFDLVDPASPHWSVVSAAITGR